MSEDYIIRPATLADLTYIDSLQRKNAEELSFYPKVVFEREIPLFRVLLAELNNEPCGYLYHGAPRGAIKIHQACIQYDLRGYLYGARLVSHLESIAQEHRATEISLRCGSDIAANGFWLAMGFNCLGIFPGGVRRMRDINAWNKPLTPRLFDDVLFTPSDRKQDASLWRKKSKGDQSQFMRGKQMRLYRQKLEADEC